MQIPSNLDVRDAYSRSRGQVSASGEELPNSLDVRAAYEGSQKTNPNIALDVRASVGPPRTSEGLFNLAKSDPAWAATATDEEIDKILDYTLENGLDVGELWQSVWPAVQQVGVDAWKGGKALVEANMKNPWDVSGNAIMNAATLGEGAVRSGADLAILGKQMEFRSLLQSLNTEEPEAVSRGRRGAERDRTPPGRRGAKKLQEQRSKDPEATRANLRNLYRGLQRDIAQRGETIEGESYVGSIMGAVNPALGEMLNRLVIPETAELYSYITGPEGMAAGVIRGTAKKAGVDLTSGALGKNITQEAEKAILHGTEKAARGVAGGVDSMGRWVENFPNRINPNRDVPVSDTHRGTPLVDALNLVSDTIGTIRKQYDQTNGQTSLARIKREADASDIERRTATVLTDGGRFEKILGPAVGAVAQLGTLSLRAGRSAARGAVDGAILALPTWDSETIGGAVGSAMAFSGAVDGLGRTIFGNREKVHQRANAWLNEQKPFVRDVLQSRGFSDDNIARFATVLEMIQGVVRGTLGQQDAEVYFTRDADFDADAKTILDIENAADLEAGNPLDAQDVLERQRKNADADTLPSRTRGVQLLAARARGRKPAVLINVDRMTPSTAIHEAVHAMSRLGDFQGPMGNIRSVLFDEYSGTGEKVNEGMIPDSEVFSAYEAYKADLDEASAKKLDQQNDTDQKKLAYMKEEILADSVESFLMDKKPLYVDQMGDFTHMAQEALAQRAGHIAEVLGWTRPARGYLTQHPSWARDGIDPRYYKSPEFDAAVNGLLQAGRKLEFHREGNLRKGIKQGARVRRDIADDQEFVTLNPKRIKKGTKMAKQYEASILFDGYDEDGYMRLLSSTRDIKAREKERAQVLTRLLQYQETPESYPDAVGEKVPLEYNPDTQQYEGNYIGRNIMRQLEAHANEGKFPRRLLDHLETMNQALRAGRMLEIDYNPRLNRARKYDSRLSSTVRIALPFSFFVTKAGNFVFNTLDMGHLADKFQRKKNKNQLSSLWKGDWDAFSKDLVTYIGNTAKNPGRLDVNGISREKANALSAFLGFKKKKDQELRNNRNYDQEKLFEEINDEGQGDNLIRSRRVDAVNSIRFHGDTEVMPLSPGGYKQIQQNFEPSGNVDRSMLGGEHLISQRLPIKAGKPTNAHIEDHLIIDSDQILNLKPDQKESALEFLKGLPMAPKNMRSLPSAMAKIKATMVDNLLWLHDEYERAHPGINERAKLWYDGARNISESISKEYNVPVEAAAAVLAALSPGKDWFVNVSIGDRLVNIYTKKQDAQVTPEMVEWMKETKVKPEQIAAMEGLKMGDMPIDLQAIFIRGYDEVYHEGSYFLITPEGGTMGRAKNDKGKEYTRAWQTYPNIIKAISVLKDSSMENISLQMGGAHKVRDFFNNIIAPNALDGSVTIDTHAAAAAVLIALAQKDLIPTWAMGGAGPQSANTGSRGLYGLFADAYRQAAKMRGLLPREMQSITWEAGRGLFTPTFKRGVDDASGLSNKEMLGKIWQEVRSGRITHEEARRQINDKAGGINAPGWFLNAGNDAQIQSAAYAPGVF